MCIEGHSGGQGESIGRSAGDIVNHGIKLKRPEIGNIKKKKDLKLTSNPTNVARG
jgi:hypothetical protein